MRQAADQMKGVRGARPVTPSTRLADLLLDSLSELAAAGEVEAACRLAGLAYVALRTGDPAGARRFDALLHRLTARGG